MGTVSWPIPPTPSGTPAPIPTPQPAIISPSAWGIDLDLAWLNPATGGADLNPYFPYVTGPQVFAQAITRRLGTPRGALFYDQDYGYDLTLWLNNTPTTSDIDTNIPAAIVAECLKDQRCIAAVATVVLDASAQSMTVNIDLTTNGGPFSLTLSVTSVTVTLVTFNLPQS